MAEAAKGRAPAGWKDSVPESLRDEASKEGVRAGVLAGWREAFAMPGVCPACGTRVVPEGKYWRCPNVYGCEPQVIGRTLQMAGRAGFEIDGLGEKLCSSCSRGGLSERRPADLFHLKRSATSWSSSTAGEKRASTT